jgi:hypothetical protein
MAQRRNGTMAQWQNGTTAQRHNGSKAQAAGHRAELSEMKEGF